MHGFRGRLCRMYTDIPWNPQVEQFLEGLIAVRDDLLVDPLLADPWSCEPVRCRPRLGPYLCCKVERRCEHFDGRGCRIYDERPFACALFPLDLVRVRGVRVVTTVKNMHFFRLGHSRFDRDMLGCFAGQDPTARPMLLAQEPLLRKIFTDAEWREVVGRVLPCRERARDYEFS